MTIEEYKARFIELFREMEKEFCLCESVFISHKDANNIESDIRCNIEF